ncbi:lysophospholipid acyltransferase [Pseudogymnoascus verrucosus]|uniref:Lysophospholipid acyltransferase n=1 Tax=Pseudogymnoascus verrucosus TaxID=342668 RepID=A0A1B8GHX8_9PEZI|nr:lysophospholipid acyltransferase [Pseudogymnoascus verrucosus]OBT95457.1 lysophospholipid acyltransferase [Pseudogymnoascus verrucosus]
MLPFINIPFEYASSIIGASPDELKLIFSFILSYPLCGVLKRIPDSKPAYKNLFIIGVSVFYLVGLFSLWDGMRTVAISAVGTYAIAQNISGPLMPWIAFVFLMVHLSINQIQRQILADPGVVDITGAQMVLVMKLSAFCWNVADGRLPESELSDLQKEKALKQLPKPLDYAAWVLFFPSLFGGPAFDFVDYTKWIECTMFELPPGVDPSKKPPTRKKRKIPRSGTPAMWKAAEGAFWIFLFLQLSGYVGTDVFIGEKFLTFGFVKRVWFLYLLGFTSRLKYYGVWALTEGACILSGLGYNGVDETTGKVSWNKLENVNPWGVETAQNSRAYLGNWNMNTNNWLRNYIYLRVTPKGKKPGFRASMATFVTSAFWHGFYPGYYLSFVAASFIQTIAKNCRRYFRPFFLDPVSGKPTSTKIYYDALSWFVTQFILCFVTAPFIILTFQDSLLVWSRVYFYALIAIGGMTAFFASPAKPYLKRQIEIRAARANGGKKLERKLSSDTLSQQPVLGLPPDPERDFEEVVREIREELDARQSKGLGRAATMPALVRKEGL